MTGSETVTMATTPETVGSLIFGDTGASAYGWNITGSGAGILTLNNNSSAPTITVDALGNTNVNITSVLSGTDGFIQEGPGTLILGAALTSLSGTVAINQGALELNANDSSANNGLTGITLGNSAGGSASLFIGPATSFVLSTPIQLGTSAVGTLTIGSVGVVHPNFGGAISLNGNNLTIETLDTLTGVLDISGGITGTGNLTFNNAGPTSLLTCETTLINNSGTITLEGTSTGTIDFSAPIGPNVTAINYNSSATPTTISSITVGTGGLTNNNNSTLTPNTGTWGGAGTLTLNCNSSGSFSLGSMKGFSGNIVNSGTGSGSTTMGVLTNASSSVTQDSGTSVLILTAAGNTYGGGTFISAGTLELTNASIPGSGNISIASGGTFDVSGLAASTFTLNSNATVSASGTGTTVGTSAAAINGQLSGFINLSTNPIVLNFNGTQPALYIPQGTLELNGNPFTVNSASPLTNNTYTIVQQASGNITTAGVYPAVTGTAIGAGQTGSISVSGGTVSLTVSSGGAPPPAKLISLVNAAGGLTMIWQGGTNQNCVLLSSTNAALPISQWTPVVGGTNAVGANGLSTNTITFNPAKPDQFFLLSIP